MQFFVTVWIKTTLYFGSHLVEFQQTLREDAISFKLD